MTEWLEWLQRYNGAIIALASVAGVLVAAAYSFFTWRLWQETKRTVDLTKESADAAVAASMPVLSPLIVGGTLHPLSAVDQPITFDAYVQFVFENYGKTPGIIRELRADLFLNEMDEFPAVEFEKLPLIIYEPMIAGDSRGQGALMGVAECTKRITLTPTEFGELLAEASEKYRRFALIGHVVYDDFFENRHTRRFCVKMRRMGETGLFQLVRGGRAYNHVYREKVPKNDPLTTDQVCESPLNEGRPFPGMKGQPP